MDHIIYKSEPPDPQQYAGLFSTTGWNDTYKVNVHELARALQGSWYIVAAYDQGQLVGIGRVVSDGVLYAMLYDIIVAPSHQSFGIGSAILERLIERCRMAGIRSIQLFSAKGKAPFYRKRGFVERPADAPGMKLDQE